MKVNILYEDNHLLIVEKPVNIPVQEDASKDLDLLTYLKGFIKERDAKPGNVYLGLVHRLDRPVGGAIVYAKTSKAASRLSDSLRKNQIKRQYLATVIGQPAQKEGTLCHYLWKDRQKNQVYVVSHDRKDAKQARLQYQVLETRDNLSLVQVELETGRSHQIRVQLQNIGCPLFGDQKYGGKKVQAQTQLALWAYKLQVPHPTRKDEVVQVISYPPQDYPWNLFRVIIEAKS